MKQYREAAFIRDGDNGVAYFIQDTRIVKEPNDYKALTALPYIKVDKEQFDTLVRRGMVQYLVWENGHIVCHLTDEERQWFKTAKVKKKYVDLIEQHYWDRDTSFEMQHITLAEQNFGLATAACNIASVLGMKLLLMAVYGSEEAISSLIKRETELKKFGLVMLNNHSANHVSLAVSAVASSVWTLSNKIDKAGFLIDTRPLRNTLTGENIKAGSLVKSVGDSKYLDLADTLDSLTKGNLHAANQRKSVAEILNSHSSSEELNTTAATTNMF